MTDFELNEQCARRLGWMEAKSNLGWLKPLTPTSDTLTIQQLPNYVGDIGAAWEIVRELQKQGKKISIHAWPDYTYTVYIRDGNGEEIEAVTAPRAIVMAFLELQEGKTE